ncbi:MAG TPA: hypothetical protein PLV23_00335 [Sedimentibacter sp.]|nr:hypothetical protein [Tissierellia bacterium]HOK49021.1 hypothetical protein [Sedimentibacter sp.]HOW22053.1 hypothetical protein [Sedimentibacter sp.]HRC79932.1 hypothetical protein [Sedimentibacter sp.]
MIIVIMVLAGGLFFLYVNFKCMIKINITFSFLCICFCMILFKKKHLYERKINYSGAIKVLGKYKAQEARSKVKHKLKYFKHIKRALKLFYVKDIFFYPECIRGKESFALEFVLVNRIFKKSLLNR